MKLEEVNPEIREPRRQFRLFQLAPRGPGDGGVVIPEGAAADRALERELVLAVGDQVADEAIKKRARSLTNESACSRTTGNWS